jgi:hypothetical protein
MRGPSAAALLAGWMYCAAFASAQAEIAVPVAPPIRGLAIGAGQGAGAAFADSPYDPANAQLWWTAGLSLEIPVLSAFGLGFLLGFRGTGASTPIMGVIYRGHYGLESGVYLYGKGRLAVAKNRRDLLGGIAAGTSVNFEVYQLTELLFFYPSLLLEPWLEMQFPRLAPHTFSLSLPARLDFRKDLDLSASVGLGLRWRWYPKHRKEQP